MLTIPRDTYLALVGMKSSTLDQRVRTGEIAWAFGVVERPSHGEYFVLDAVATILSSMLSCLCGLTLKQTTDGLRKHWSGWLELVTKVERWQEKYPGTGDPMWCIAIAHLPLKLGQSESERSHRILLGKAHEIIEEVGATADSCNFVSIARVLSALKANAKNAGIKLPARLTIAKGEAGFDEWRTEIREYQRRAGMRIAKPRPVTA
jgi:hypothetical protein